MDNQVSEAQLLEAEFAGGISSGRLLYRQVDKEGRASVLHQDSLSKQLKKVGGAGQIRWWRVVGGAGQIRWWRVVGGAGQIRWWSAQLPLLRWLVCHCSIACWQVMDLVQ